MTTNPDPIPSVTDELGKEFERVYPTASPAWAFANGYASALSNNWRPPLSLDEARPHESIATQLGRIYDHALVLARATAYEHGYAIAVHGSEMRDLDLIGVPWTAEASDADTLAEAIRARTGGTFGQNPRTERPHGRLSWSIHLNNEHSLGNFKPVLPYIDLSVMPLSVRAEDEQRRLPNGRTQAEERAWLYEALAKECQLTERLRAEKIEDEQRLRTLVEALRPFADLARWNELDGDLSPQAGAESLNLDGTMWVAVTPRAIRRALDVLNAEEEAALASSGTEAAPTEKQ